MAGSGFSKPNSKEHRQVETNGIKPHCISRSDELTDWFAITPSLYDRQGPKHRFGSRVGNLQFFSIPCRRQSRAPTFLVIDQLFDSSDNKARRKFSRRRKRSSRLL